MTVLFQKRIEMLAELGSVQVSKGGNYYVVLRSSKANVLKTFSTRSVTKNTLSKLNTDFTYPKVHKEIVMLTLDNKLKFKQMEKNNYTPLSSKIVANNFSLAKLYLFNKKSEYLRHYHSGFLNHFNLLKSFKSMKEVFAFLGVTAKVEFTIENLEKLIEGYNFKNKTILIEGGLQNLRDCTRLAKTLEIDITQTNKSIINLHDDLIKITNNREAESYSDEVIIPLFFYELKEILDNYSAIYYTSKRALFLAGKTFHNCISGRSHRLHSDMFFSINITGVDMIFQVNKEGIVEGKGKYNKYDSERVLIVAEILKFVIAESLPF